MYVETSEWQWWWLIIHICLLTSTPWHVSTATPAVSSLPSSLALAAAGEGSGLSSTSICSASALAVIHPGGLSVAPLGILTLPNSEPLLHSGEQWLII
jgi:hypothetical protein